MQLVDECVAIETLFVDTEIRSENFMLFCNWTYHVRTSTVTEEFKFNLYALHYNYYSTFQVFIHFYYNTFTINVVNLKIKKTVTKCFDIIINGSLTSKDYFQNNEEILYTGITINFTYLLLMLVCHY